VIRPVYFEKVVSMCKEDNSSQTSGIKGTEKAPGKTSDKTASKSSTIAGSQNYSSTSKKDTDVVTSPLLSACLDIFIVLVEEAPENVFLGENSVQLKEVLETSFNYARQSDEDALRRKLRRFVVQFLTASKEKPHSEGNIMRHVNVLVEKLLLDAEKEQRKSVGSGNSSLEPNRQGGSRGKTAAPEQDEEKFCMATFALEIIEEVSQTHVAYFKAFSSALLGLATTLVKKHTTAASAKQKQSGATYVPQSGASSFRQMYHTPVEGIIGESCSSDISQPTATGISKSTNSRDPHPSKELSEFDQTLRSAVIILQILGDSDLPFSFTQDRKTLFQIISSILDSSNSVQLLMAAVRIVGKWLLSDLPGGPLTVKERNSFLWKIASFDFNGLPDVVSQPLADLVAHYVISFLNLRGLGLPGACGSKQNNSTAGGISHSSITPQRASDNDDMIMGRSLMACLLTPNFDLREELLSLYASQNDDAVKKQGGEKMKAERDSQGSRQIPQRGPFEVLWHLFHSDFEGLGGRFWIVLFVELLLASIQPNQNEERVKWLPRPKTNPPLVKTVLADPSLKDDYSNFCDSLIGEKSDVAGGGFRLITALRKLAHGDIVICQQLFETLLSAGWEKIHSDGLRLKLVPAIESLLSRPFHSQFLRESDRRRQEPRAMNVIRAFLNGISKLTPLPSLDVDLLVSLGENYNCWYEVLSLLEQQHFVLSSNNISSEGVAMRDKTFLAMRHCYRQLGETDIWMSLAVKSCDLSETKLAVSLDIHGKVNEALDTYTNLVELVESGEKSPSEFEMDLLEERWVELNREQCQLQVVSEYAQSCENPRLLLECAWKDQKWDKVRALASSSSLVAAVEAGDPAVKMSETLLAVADGKLSDVENLHAQTAQLCLYKWQLLPELSSGSLSHASLLHFFHRLVEIRESGQIMVETSNHSNGKTLPDLKNLLK
jgi:transformation/transcription domain-associated protein